MKRIKKAFITIISLVLVIGLIGTSCVFATKTNTKDKTYIELSCNTALMHRVFSDESKNQAEAGSKVLLSLNDDDTNLNITLLYRGKQYSATLKGESQVINGFNHVGYVGVYDGYLVDENSTNNSKQYYLTTADITKVGSDIFCSLTIKFGEEIPCILLFGDRTEGIKDISKALYELCIASNSVVEPIENDKGLTVNGEMTYKGSQSIMINGRAVAGFHVFHAPELRNQGEMTVKVKMNTSKSAIETYIKTDLGYGDNYIYATPDRIEMSIRGESNLHASMNSYEPVNGTTSCNMVVPYYLYGFGTITIPMTFSSTVVSTSAYPASSFYNNNKVKWTMKKNLGWGIDTFEGNQASQKGMAVSSEYKYEGNVTSSFTVYLQETGYIEFRYFVNDNGDTLDLHFNTNTVTKYTSLIIVP